ncbi:hypothetical protein [Comamonas sp. JC664]|uniref:hypothetical protein n=1 Tax=Comamonas sp. JC664 TaxID=2801917 RepID=UPI0017495F8A|nr:hypothetical protein [Comamonas sp. JC664]MBL0696451.1 hypothetical protein [Comamonas sp. JC664]GHG84300.1 hypothetical protein GCM10012319_39750 [Comamonas sp. KCTC 72670]
MTLFPPPEVQDAAPRQKRWRRAALWGLGFVLLLEVALNVALNVGAVQTLMARSTSRTELTWKRAWWLWPFGQLHLSGFTLTQQNKHQWWQVNMDTLDANVSLTALLRKRVDVQRIDGKGAKFRIEPSYGIEDEPPPGPDYQPWVIQLADVTVHEVRELNFGRVRFVGDLDVQGLLDIKGRDHVHVETPAIRVNTGFMEVDMKPVTRLERLEATAQLDVPFTEEKGWDLSQALSARIQGELELLPLDWLNEHLGTRSAVSLRGGGGKLDLDLRLQENAVASGTRIKAAGAELDVRAGPIRARAPWRVEASMEAARTDVRQAKLRLALAPVRVSGPEGTGAEVPEIILTLLATRSTGQSDWEVEPDLRVAKSRPVDLKMLNPWLARTIEIESGSMTVQSQERTKASKPRDSLRLSVDSDLVTGRMGDIKVLLRAEADVDARNLSWDTKSLSLTGTTVRLSNVSTNGPVPIRAWSGVFTLPQARLSLSPTVLSARFASKLTDTQPIVALLTSAKNLPAFLTSVLNIRNVSITGRVQVDEQGLQLRELKADGENFSLEGHLDLVQGRLTGALLAKLGIVTGGIEFKPGGQNVHLLNAKQWFDKQPAPPFR